MYNVYRIGDYYIKIRLKDKDQIIEFNAENKEEVLYFAEDYKIEYLEKKFFQNKNAKEIKKEIDKFFQEKKISIILGDDSQNLQLVYQNEKDKFNVSLKYNIQGIITYLSKIEEDLKKDFSDSSSKDDKNYKIKHNKKIFAKEIVPEKVNITFLSFFPSGNTIIGCWDGKLKIYKTFDTKQKYSEYKAHNSCVMYISIKDDNEFASCSDIEIKIFNIKKEKNEFIFENKLYFDNAHNDVINKILYSENNLLFSCSMDGYIKIWNLNNNDENKVIINENDNVFCFDYINEDKIFISSGVYGTNIYNITINYNNNRLISSADIKLSFKEAVCYSRFGMTKMYDDKFIVCGNYINIISLNEEKIIFTKKLNFTIWDCFVKEDEELFVIGNSNNIVILIQSNLIDNKYKVLKKINEFENKNYFRIVNMRKDSYIIFSTFDDLFKFDYTVSVEDYDKHLIMEK